jgi:predicted O-methyltransferase YrrM
MNHKSKLYLLLGLLCKHPMEFWDRVGNFIEVGCEGLRPHGGVHHAIPLEALITLLSKSSNWDLDGPLHEAAIRQIERHVCHLASSSNGNRPFNPLHNTDIALARFCYAVCRALSPDAVVETGVAYGVTTSFVLQALAQNEKGKLWSIDLPPLCAQADQSVGLFVPQELRASWELERGLSRKRLPGLLARLQTIDLFIHDSLHTRSNMSWEFEIVWPHLRPGGVLIADDVQGQPAFPDFVAQTHPRFSAIVVEKSKNAAFGVAVKTL